MSDNGIVWEDPPPQEGRGGPRKWHSLLEPLMDRPGAWARIAERDERSRAHVTASNLRTGKNSLPPGRWEFTSRSVDDEAGIHYFVYARYLGPEDAA